MQWILQEPQVQTRIADLTLRKSFALQNVKILTVQMLKTQNANKENPVYFILQKLKFSE